MCMGGSVRMNTAFLASTILAVVGAIGTFIVVVYWAVRRYFSIGSEAKPEKWRIQISGSSARTSTNKVTAKVTIGDEVFDFKGDNLDDLLDVLTAYIRGRESPASQEPGHIFARLGAGGFGKTLLATESAVVRQLEHEQNLTPDMIEPVEEHTDELRVGEQLADGQAIHSSDDRFRLVLQNDGNLIVFFGTAPLWKSDTARTRGAYRLTLQDDGNLVLHAVDGAVIWATDTAGTNARALVMQTDGNLVLYSDIGPVWSSWIGLLEPARDS